MMSSQFADRMINAVRQFDTPCIMGFAFWIPPLPLKIKVVIDKFTVEFYLESINQLVKRSGF